MTENEFIEECKKIINKSFDAVIMFSIPLTIFVFYYSPHIIKFIFGIDFVGSVTPLRIMALLKLFNFNADLFA